MVMIFAMVVLWFFMTLPPAPLIAAGAALDKRLVAEIVNWRQWRGCQLAIEMASKAGRARVSV